MPAQLTEDRRDGECGETVATRGVEAIDGLDQSEAGHLQEIVEGLGGAHIATRETPGQRHEMGGELIPSGSVSLTLPAFEEDRQALL